MKYLKIPLFLSLFILTLSCTENPYYEIPTDEAGDPILTEVSEVTTSGITTADNEFTVTAWLPNASPGDEMRVDLLKNQPHPDAESDQLLPLEGASKTVTVNEDLEATATFTKEEADMQKVGDWVEVIFNGATASAQIRVTLESAN